MGFKPFVYKTPQYGESDYKSAVARYEDYASKYSDIVSSALEPTKEAVGEARQLTKYYQPEGGYGKGQKQQAKQTIQQGVAKAQTSQVRAGMSSQFAARGTQVLAASELSKLYANIEDTRNALLMQAFTPYAQMIQTLGNLSTAGANVIQAQPKRAQYVTQGKPYISGYGGMSGGGPNKLF